MTAPTPRPDRIPDIDLDDRRWQDLVNQALALRTTYAPQWTDRNASDVGVTLVELFAWLVEGLIFKLNRVPDKTYVTLRLMPTGSTPVWVSAVMARPRWSLRSTSTTSRTPARPRPCGTWTTSCA